MMGGVSRVDQVPTALSSVLTTQLFSFPSQLGPELHNIVSHSVMNLFSRSELHVSLWLFDVGGKDRKKKDLFCTSSSQKWSLKEEQDFNFNMPRHLSSPNQFESLSDMVTTLVKGSTEF